MPSAPCAGIRIDFYPHLNQVFTHPAVFLKWRGVKYGAILDDDQLPTSALTGCRYLGKNLRYDSASVSTVMASTADPETSGSGVPISGY